MISVHVTLRHDILSGLFLGGFACASTSALEEEKGAMAENISNQMPSVEATTVSYSFA
jgi:hypothetical protein